MSDYITININITIDKDKEKNFYQSLDDNLIINSWELPIAKQKYKQELEEIKKEFQIECLEDMETGKRTYRSVKLLNYKEALDEIEGYRICEINDEDEEENDTILSIINETKEEIK